MSEPFFLVLNTNVHNGQVDNARNIIHALVDDVEHNEPGTIAYNCYGNVENGNLCFVDNYASSEAFLTHVSRSTVGEALDKIMAICDVNNLTVFGNVTPEAKTALDQWGATYLPQLVGFDRITTPVTH